LRAEHGRDYTEKKCIKEKNLKKRVLLCKTTIWGGEGEGSGRKRVLGLAEAFR
jgi:hypothetical protein